MSADAQYDADMARIDAEYKDQIRTIWAEFAASVVCGMAIGSTVVCSILGSLPWPVPVSVVAMPVAVYWHAYTSWGKR